MKIIRIEKCGECPDYDHFNEHGHCYALAEDVDPDTIPDWCPLENMPPIDWDKVAEDEFLKDMEKILDEQHKSRPLGRLGKRGGGER